MEINVNALRHIHNDEGRRYLANQGKNVNDLKRLIDEASRIQFMGEQLTHSKKIDKVIAKMNKLNKQIVPFLDREKRKTKDEEKGDEPTATGWLDTARRGANVIIGGAEITGSIIRAGGKGVRWLTTPGPKKGLQTVPISTPGMRQQPPSPTEAGTGKIPVTPVAPIEPRQVGQGGGAESGQLRAENIRLTGEIGARKRERDEEREKREREFAREREQYEREIHGLQQERGEQKEREPGPDRGAMLTLIKDNLSDKQTKLISTPIMASYLKPAETKKSGGIKMVQKTVVNQKARRKKAATRTRTSEYAALKKRVQARIRKERMGAYRSHGKRITKLPVKERK